VDQHVHAFRQLGEGRLDLLRVGRVERDRANAGAEVGRASTSARRPVITTSSPSSAKVRATARPIPVPPPVTTTFRI
jgi:hypothetical protein